jgi:hypothetical protein
MGWEGNIKVLMRTFWNTQNNFLYVCSPQNSYNRDNLMLRFSIRVSFRNPRTAIRCSKKNTGSAVSRLELLSQNLPLNSHMAIGFLYLPESIGIVYLLKSSLTADVTNLKPRSHIWTTDRVSFAHKIVEVFFKFLWKNPAFSSLAVYSLLLLVLF